MHICIYMHTYIHIYIHIYIHTHICYVGLGFRNQVIGSSVEQKLKGSGHLHLFEVSVNSRKKMKLRMGMEWYEQSSLERKTNSQSHSIPLLSSKLPFTIGNNQ